MTNIKRYADDLRCIGQLVETKNINYFEVKRLGSSYTVKATVDETLVTPRTLKWLQLLRSKSDSGFIVGVDDLQRLAETGRARRTNSGKFTQFRNVSNVLRTIGTYLDSSEFELIELHKRAISMTLIYRDKAGHDQREDRAISSFYKLFLDLCGKRINSNYSSPLSKVDAPA